MIQLYQKGITTREIGDLIQKMYGHHYSPATLSNITKLVDKDVKAFHSRPIKSRYVIFYCDALSGLKDALLEEFPKGRHQTCWLHINRNLMKHIRAKNKAEVGDDLRLSHQSIDLKAALENYDKFIEKWSRRYPKAKQILEKHDNLYTYLTFPK